MAVASLVSRITGFLRQLALVAVLGLGVVNDSYTVANTLPNIVYELLLGGVLTSVMVPLLIRAQTEDADGGEAYTRRLLTMAGRCSPGSTSAAADRRTDSSRRPSPGCCCRRSSSTAWAPCSARC
jgi:peptidoglycan biosynthesis protein MviN/MurJ (putative lipid II flippase)